MCRCVRQYGGGGVVAWCLGLLERCKIFRGLGFAVVRVRDQMMRSWKLGVVQPPRVESGLKYGARQGEDGIGLGRRPESRDC